MLETSVEGVTRREEEVESKIGERKLRLSSFLSDPSYLLIVMIV